MKSRHTLSYCKMCEIEMVICADCGINCCNGGTKEVNGKKCGCKEAYEHQDLYEKGENVIFVKR